MKNFVTMNSVGIATGIAASLMPAMAGCLKLQPTIEELKNEFDGKVKVVSIELDENLDVIKTQNIKTLPTLRIYKHGQIAWEHRGRTTKEQLETEIKNNL